MRRALVLLLPLLIWATPAAATPIDPQRTWAVVVGVLDYLDPALDDFPQALAARQDAQLVEWLRQVGVPSDRVAFLADRAATSEAVGAALGVACAGSRPGDTLLFYFTGHGERIDGRGFVLPADARGDALGDSGLALEELVRDLEANFRGDRVLAIVDCCYSGSLGDEVQALTDRRLEWCCLASAEPTALSTARWTFTRCVLKALRGDPGLDSDGDGAVALGELRRFAVQEMAFVERQMPDFVTTRSFPAELRLAQVRGSAAPTGVGARVEVLEDGVWYRATVRRAEAGRVWVDYPDYDDGWVLRGSCREWQPATFQADLRVLVEWEGSWWPARVLRSQLGLHRIHYDGHEDSWDEWVSPDRLRLGPY